MSSLVDRHGASVDFIGQTEGICRLQWTDMGHLSSLVDRQREYVVFSGLTGGTCRL